MPIIKRNNSNYLNSKNIRSSKRNINTNTHNSMSINKNIKEREGLKENIKRIKNKKESWPCNGQKGRYELIFKYNLKNKPILFLKQINKKNPNVMFLGAGEGSTIVGLKNELKNYKIKPNFDTFSITKSLNSKAKRVVRKDYSQNILFEKFNTKNSKFKFLENKYDLIVGAMSVGYHTNYPANAIFTSAMMLNKGGRAYIELDHLMANTHLTKNKNTFFKFLKSSFIPRSLAYEQKQVLSINKIFDRFVRSLAPNKSFVLKPIKYKDPSNANNNSYFLEVIRTK